VTIETPAAYRFIIDEDLYLLKQDKVEAPTLIPEAATVIIAKTELVAIPEATPIPTPVIDFKYLGNHKKRFLILVHYPDCEFIDNEHLSALTNILKRKELTMEDVAILNLANYTVVFNEVMQFFKPQRLLLMGKNSLPVNIEPLPLNQPKQLEGYRALYSFSFDEMMSSNDNKKAYWEQMKTL
jgi:hypothetical protein